MIFHKNVTSIKRIAGVIAVIFFFIHVGLYAEPNQPEMGQTQTDGQKPAQGSNEEAEPFDLSQLSPEEMARITKEIQEEIRKNAQATKEDEALTATQFGEQPVGQELGENQDGAEVDADLDDETRAAAVEGQEAALLGGKKEIKTDFKLRAALAAYALWRKGFETYKFHRAHFTSDGKVSEKSVNKHFQFFEKYIIRTIGSMATVAEKWDEWQQKGYVAPGLEGIMMGSAQPQLLRNLQVYWQDAGETNSLYEQRFHFLTQLAFKFAPSIAYHIAMRLSDWGTESKGDNWKGYSVLKENTIPERAVRMANPSAFCKRCPDEDRTGYVSEYDYSYEGLGLDQPAATRKTKGLYWSFTKVLPPLHWLREWWVRTDHDDCKKICEEGSGDWKSIGYAPIDETDLKKNIVHSYLYRRAFTSSMHTLTSQLTSYFEKLIEERAGEAKINDLSQKTFGVVDPHTLTSPVCRGLANILLYNVAQSGYLSWVVPQFTKIDLGMCEDRDVPFIREKHEHWSLLDETMRKSKNLGIHRDFQDGLKGNALYLFKEIKEQALRSFGMHTAPLLLAKFTDNRKNIGNWVNGKLLAAGQGLVKLGVCSTNPVENMEKAFQHAVLDTMKDNPFILEQLLTVSMTMQQQIEGQKLFQRLMSGDIEAILNCQRMLQGFQKALAKIQHACSLKHNLMRLQIRNLVLRSDERYKRAENELNETMDETMNIIESEGLLVAVFDTGALTALTTIAPWFSKWGGDAAVSLGATIERKLIQTFGSEDAPINVKKDPDQDIFKQDVSGSTTFARPPKPPTPDPAVNPTVTPEPGPVAPGNFKNFVYAATGGAVGTYALIKLYNWYQARKLEAAKTPAQKERDGLIERLKTAYKDYKKDKLTFKDYNALETELLAGLDEAEKDEVKLRAFMVV